MTTYLAGPMTGIPDFNRPAFERAALNLRSRHGMLVYSPIEADVTVYGSWEEAIKHPWEEHLARDLVIVPKCAAIALLPGWERSTGANLELHVARVFNLEVLDARTGIKMDPYLYVGPNDERVFTAPPVEATQYSRDHKDDSSAHFDPAATAWTAEASEGRFVPYGENQLRQTQVTGGMKDDKGKSRLDLLPSAPLVEVGHILAFGAWKYKPHNWRLGLKWSDTLASAQRHIMAWNDGEFVDAETGRSHLSHAICQLLFLSEYEIKGTGIRDLWVPAVEGPGLEVSV